MDCLVGQLVYWEKYSDLLVWTLQLHKLVNFLIICNSRLFSWTTYVLIKRNRQWGLRWKKKTFSLTKTANAPFLVQASTSFSTCFPVQPVRRMPCHLSLGPAAQHAASQPPPRQARPMPPNSRPSLHSIVFVPCAACERRRHRRSLVSHRAATARASFISSPSYIYSYIASQSFVLFGCQSKFFFFEKRGCQSKVGGDWVGIAASHRFGFLSFKICEVIMDIVFQKYSNMNFVQLILIQLCISYVNLLLYVLTYQHIYW